MSLSSIFIARLFNCPPSIANTEGMDLLKSRFVSASGIGLTSGGSSSFTTDLLLAFALNSELIEERRLTARTAFTDFWKVMKIIRLNDEMMMRTGKN